MSHNELFIFNSKSFRTKVIYRGIVQRYCQCECPSTHEKKKKRTLNLRKMINFHAKMIKLLFAWSLSVWFWHIRINARIRVRCQCTTLNTDQSRLKRSSNLCFEVNQHLSKVESVIFWCIWILDLICLPGKRKTKNIHIFDPY